MIKTNNLNNGQMTHNQAETVKYIERHNLVDLFEEFANKLYSNPKPLTAFSVLDVFADFCTINEIKEASLDPQKLGYRSSKGKIEVENEAKVIYELYKLSDTIPVFPQNCKNYRDPLIFEQVIELRKKEKLNKNCKELASACVEEALMNIGKSVYISDEINLKKQD